MNVDHYFFNLEWFKYTGSRSSVGSESDCRSRGHDFNPSLVRYLDIDLELIGPQCEKTCLRRFANTKAQTSLRIHEDWSAPLLFAYRKVSYLDLLRAKFQFTS